MYYVETRIVRTGTDTTVYGIGYAIHYLFKKLKRGIDASNLASVAASAQLQSNKIIRSFLRCQEPEVSFEILFYPF